MQVRDGMSEMVLTVGPGHTLRQAAQLMSKRRVGAAVVMDPESSGPGILTERDLLDSLAEGQDPDTERVGDHMSPDIVFAAPEWSLEEAAVAMARMPPAPQTHQLKVTPTSAAVRPTVSSSGWMEPPGRWISSPTGGISGSSGLTTRRSPRRRRSCRT